VADIPDWAKRRPCLLSRSWGVTTYRNGAASDSSTRYGRVAVKGVGGAMQSAASGAEDSKAAAEAT
jgi:hypothetical protein